MSLDLGYRELKALKKKEIREALKDRVIRAFLVFLVIIVGFIVLAGSLIWNLDSALTHDFGRPSVEVSK